MTSLLRLLDEQAAAERRDAGMDRAATTAGPSWAAMAYEWLRTYLRQHQFFHVDEFWDWSLSRGMDMGPSPRGFGAVIQRAARDGLMTKTRISMPSVRSNLSPKPVWRSATYRGVRNNIFRGERIP